MKPLPKHREQFEFSLSPIKAIELKAASLPDVVSLAQGIPGFQTPQIIKDFTKEAIDRGACDRYSLPAGLTALREEIAAQLEEDQTPYDPDSEILITAGAMEAITATMLALLSPGDEVIIPSPTYPAYERAVLIAGCRPIHVPLYEEKNFDFQIEQIAKKITRKTKAIFYCSPNNPTGTIYSETSTRELIKLAETYGLYIITDEVYKDFYYNDDSHFSPITLSHARDRIIRICSFSKAFSMTGWRVGFLHSAEPVVSQILKYHDSLITCAPVVSQYAAIAALRYGDEHIQSFRNKYRKHRDYTIEMLDQISHVIDYQTPQSAYFVFPRIKDCVQWARNSERLANDILEKARVAVVPGSAFGPSGESHLRIVFGRDRETLEAGMSRLVEYFSGTRRITPRQQATEQTTQNEKWRLSHYLTGIAARLFLKRTQPLVVGIIGKRGKTVLKRALGSTLESQFRTRTGILSYNTTIGLPLSILSLTPPKTLPEKILFPFQLLKKTFFWKDNTEILVVEYGANSLSEAKKLRTICSPDWLIITNITSIDQYQGNPELLNAIDAFTSQMPSERIFWDGTDPLLKTLSKLNARNRVLPLEEKKNDGFSLVGDSARFASQAAQQIYRDLAKLDS